MRTYANATDSRLLTDDSGGAPSGPRHHEPQAHPGTATSRRARRPDRLDRAASACSGFAAWWSARSLSASSESCGTSMRARQPA